MLGNWWDSLRAWVGGMFTPRKRAAAVAAMEKMLVHADAALAIVRRIDASLKPQIKDARENHTATPMIVFVADFLRKGGYDALEADVLASKIVGLPYAELLTNVAILCLSKQSNGEKALGIMRHAIAFAYDWNQELNGAE